MPDYSKYLKLICGDSVDKQINLCECQYTGLNNPAFPAPEIAQSKAGHGWYI
jgi:hypothetical protein